MVVKFADTKKQIIRSPNVQTGMRTNNFDENNAQMNLSPMKGPMYNNYRQYPGPSHLMYAEPNSLMGQSHGYDHYQVYQPNNMIPNINSVDYSNYMQVNSQMSNVKMSKYPNVNMTNKIDTFDSNSSRPAYPNTRPPEGTLKHL